MIPDFSNVGMADLAKPLTSMFDQTCAVAAAAAGVALAALCTLFAAKCRVGIRYRLSSTWAMSVTMASRKDGSPTAPAFTSNGECAHTMSPAFIAASKDATCFEVGHLNVPVVAGQRSGGNGASCHGMQSTYISAIQAWTW